MAMGAIPITSRFPNSTLPELTTAWDMGPIEPLSTRVRVRSLARLGFRVFPVRFHPTLHHRAIPSWSWVGTYCDLPSLTRIVLRSLHYQLLPIPYIKGDQTPN